MFNTSSLEKKSLGNRELENFMKQVVDFKCEEQIIAFIKVFKSSLFDNTSQGTNLVHKKASFSGFLTIAYIFKHYDHVFNSNLDFSFYYFPAFTAFISYIQRQ
jgi:hypothetical protein